MGKIARTYFDIHRLLNPNFKLLGFWKYCFSIKVFILYCKTPYLENK